MRAPFLISGCEVDLVIYLDGGYVDFCCYFKISSSLCDLDSMGELLWTWD
jgi:hypothetical protein